MIFIKKIPKCSKLVNPRNHQIKRPIWRSKRRRTARCPSTDKWANPLKKLTFLSPLLNRTRKIMDIDSRFLSKNTKMRKTQLLLSSSRYKPVDPKVKKRRSVARCPSVENWANPYMKLTFLSPLTEFGKLWIMTHDVTEKIPKCSKFVSHRNHHIKLSIWWSKKTPCRALPENG